MALCIDHMSFDDGCEICILQAKMQGLKKELDQERKVVQSLARSYYQSEVRHTYRDKKYVAEVKSVKHAIEQAVDNINMDDETWRAV